jgi:hypothetical protein
MPIDEKAAKILLDARDKLVEVLKNGQQALEIVNKKVREMKKEG